MNTPRSERFLSMLAGLAWMLVFNVIGLRDVGMTQGQEMVALLVPLLAIMVAVRASMMLHRERTRSTRTADDKTGWQGPG